MRGVMLGGVCAAAAMGLGGCIFVAETTRVYSADPITRAEMTDLIDRTRDLRVGMSRDEALGMYPAQHLNLKSSTTAENAVFEEWQVEAWSTRDRDVHFRRYLYFADNRLAAFSDSRIEYRENTDLMRSWLGR